MPRRSSDDLYICAIGASAGGLEALEAFFDAVDPTIDLAYVVIQHLAPDFDSQMHRLLSRHTRLPVTKIEDGQSVAPRKVYLNLPGKDVIITNGRFCVAPADESESVKLPIDRFFRSLAQDAGRRAIAVVLSGTGSDGSRGAREIKRLGGLVVAQNAEEADFDGMPKSLVQSGNCDLSLAARSIPAALSSYVLESLSPEQLAGREVPSDREDDIAAIERLLRNRFGIDFSTYKPSTILRRIEKRQRSSGNKFLGDYRRLLEAEPAELGSLYCDLLIGVTRFFRDSESFQALREYYAQNPDRVLDGLRVWVPACATGEEPYSIAILLHQLAEQHGSDVWPKIFATDVHQPALQFAGKGMFSDERLAGMDPAIRERYFEREDDSWQVIPELRQAIVFAHHNVIEDPPFTQMDLVSCRNLLIYFQPATQEKVLTLLHFAIKTRGLLMLGNSETVTPISDEFDVISGKHRLYRKRRGVRLISQLAHPTIAAPANRVRGSAAEQRDRGAYVDALIDRHAPPSFAVNPGFMLQHSFGGAERYLSVPAGATSTYLPDLVRRDLRAPLSAALSQARRGGQPVRYGDIVVADDQDQTRFTLIVSPMRGIQGAQDWYLIELQTAESRESVGTDEHDDSAPAASARYVTALEADLAYTRENLQSTVEELEASNEELQATNEELMAANEELQGTNEELQSVNEELHTVNSEYQHNLDELQEMSANMSRLLRHTDSGALYLDEDLRIRQFTERFADLLQLKEQDVGRPFMQFAAPLGIDNLESSLRNVLRENATMEFEVSPHDGATYLLRVVGIDENVSQSGCVLLLVDISSWYAEAQSAQRLANVVQQAQEAIIATTADGEITSWNAGAEALFGYVEDEAVGRDIAMLIPEDRVDEEKDCISRLLAGKMVDPFETIRRHRDGSDLTVIQSLSPVRDSAGRVTAISSVAYDITALKRAELALEKTVRQREHFLALLSHELRNPMMALLSASSVLESTGTDAAVRSQAVSAIRRQVEHMSDLLEDLLDASRMRRDRLEMSLRNIDLRDTVQAVIEEVKPAADARNVKLAIDVADARLCINGDPSRLKQLQVNLLMNAVRYSTDGDTIRFSMLESDGIAVISVTDEGVGMNAETLARIYEPFYQGAESDTDTVGIGLGLALAKSIAEGHRGTILADSAGPGQGSTFEVTIPLSRETAQVIDVGSEPDGKNDNNGAGKTILLVDDDDDGRAALALLLRHRGHSVYEVDCGVNAIRVAENTTFDVAIVDLGLPDISGIEVGRQLSCRPDADDVKLIALTGFGQARDVDATQEVGFDLHLVKPVQLDVIDREIAGC